jgi:hypothetical protein
VLIIILSISLTAVAYSASLKDIDQSKYPEDVGMLLDFGILQGNKDLTFKPASEITRSEFLVIITRLLGIEKESKAVEERDVFVDVDKDYWAAQQIDFCKQIGIISGDSNGKFYPDESIKYEEAIKVLVYCLGYDYFAKAKGGYPTGYLTISAEKGISKGLQATIGAAITRDTAAKLIANALDVDIIQQTGFGTDAKYDVAKGVTLLSKNLKIIKYSGIVEETSVTKLDNSNSSLNEEEVKISGVIYRVGSTNAKDYLGYQVEFYVDESQENEKGKIVYIKPKNDNKILVVSADDILRDDSEFSAYKFIYKDIDEKRQKIAISSDVDMIYNGKAMPGYATNNLRPITGKVTLLDRNNDGLYDVIFVFDAAVYVVASISKDNGDYLIYDRHNSNNLVRFEKPDGTSIYNIIKDGTEIEAKDIKKWDVLQVGTSANSDYRIVYASSNVVTGIIEEIETEGIAIKSITVSGKVYKVSSNYESISNPGTNDKAKKLKLGMEGSFYLDSDGKVQATDIIIAKGLQYGYLLEAGTYKVGMEQRAKFKILSTNSEIQIYSSNDKVVLNGIFKKSETVFEEVYNSKPVNDKRQLVQYELDDKNLITKLNTVTTDGDLKYGGSFTNVNYYDYYSETWSSKFYKDSKTKIFYIYNDEELCKVKNAFDAGVSSPVTLYTLDFYNLNEGRVADVIVYPMTGTSSTKGEDIPISAALTIVESVIDTLDKDENKVKGIKGYAANKAVKLIPSVKLAGDVKTVYDSIRPGDIIVYVNDGLGRVSGIMKVFDKTKPDVFGSSANAIAPQTPASLTDPTGKRDYMNMHQERKWVYGVVDEITDGYFLYHLDVGDIRTQRISSSVLVSQLDITNPNSPKISTDKTYADLKKGDKVFWRATYNSIKELVIIKTN